MHQVLRHIQHILAALIMLSAPQMLQAQLNTDQVLRVGQNALYFEDYMVAIQYFNQVIAAKPYLGKPYFFRAIAKINLDDYAGAEADATAAIMRNPFITDAYEVRGVARQNLGKTAEALTDYRRVLEDKPDNRNVLYNMALGLVDTKDYDEAEKSFNHLIRRYPKFDGGYLARAKMLMQRGDTIGALDDVNRAIALNTNATNAYIMRAEIALADSNGYARALPDMDMAVKLQPQSAGLYINRAFLRYQNDDYIGAMADYDYALSLDPVNVVALYNRGLLRAEVRDFNNAIEDFSGVIKQNPAQYRAIFNRANLYREIGDYDNAYADINAVIEAFPTFAAAWYLRGDIQYHRGRQRDAERDYNHSISLAKKKVEMLPDSDIGGGRGEAADSAGIFGESQEAVAARFSSLLRIEDMATTPREYSSGSTRGQIQNTDFAIQLLPIYFLTYYTEPTELKMSSDYVREVDAVNATKALRETLKVAFREPAITDNSIINRHFSSIDYYNAYFASRTPRAVDYFGRGMDFMTLHNYDEAMRDFDRAINASPDFTVAYLMRAAARWKKIEAAAADTEADHGKDAAMMRRAEVNAVIDDLDRVIALSPQMAIAWYDKGCVYAADADYHSAMEAFDRAIALKPDLGEAYYNRGYVNMMLGNKSAAFADLSRAGQLGIAPSYNLIKRMSR